MPSSSVAMGGATFFLFQPPITTALGHRLHPKALHVYSKYVPSFPSKIKKRRNHLRPKILKTLTKPLPTSPLPQILPTEIVIDTVLDDKFFEKVDKVENFTVTESVNTPVEYNGFVDKISAKSVLKFCGFVIGVFFIQTITAIWVFGNDGDSEDKDGSFNGLNRKGKVFLYGDVALGSELGGVVHYNEEKLEERVNEIRVMARKARQIERRARERSSGSGIEKEIGARLDRMEKKLNARRENMPEKVMEYMGLSEGVKDEFCDDDDEDEDQNQEDDVNLREEDRKLMFKNKFRFRSPSVNRRSSPKGFSGLKENNASGTPGGRELSLNLKQTYGRELDKERNDLRKERKSGVVQGSSEGKSSDEVTKSQNLNGWKLQSSGKLAEDNQETAKKSGRYGSFGGKAERRRSIINTPPKQSEPQTDAWWMKLPYVLAILMRRGSENDAAGFYALSSSSQLDNQDSSFMVVFEDRGDANNFCYLLDSFFEELGDFRADIVPLSTEEVKSQYDKLIAVKKAQLKLYAGQPMEDVEMALLSLIEQNQSA